MDRPETSLGTKLDCRSYHPFQQRQRRVATTVCFAKCEVDAKIVDTGLKIVSFLGGWWTRANTRTNTHVNDLFVDYPSPLW